MNTEQRLIEVIREARRQNEWAVIEVCELHPGGDGLVPHGLVRFNRPNSPLGEGLSYGTAEWANPIGARFQFQRGHYDLDERGAANDYALRRSVGRAG
jgi:hypothetical protein